MSAAPDKMLDGVRVLDLSRVMSGPFCTAMFADLGAEVIKIERPEGDFARGYDAAAKGQSSYFVWLNRGKQSAVVDLTTKEGRAELEKLIASADVLIQNFRPGVAERIGVGEAAIRAVNEQIIYVSIAGFGFDGPFANKPVFDPLIQAVSGLTTVQAGSDEQRPRLVKLPRSLGKRRNSTHLLLPVHLQLQRRQLAELRTLPLRQLSARSPCPMVSPFQLLLQPKMPPRQRQQ